MRFGIRVSVRCYSLKRNLETAFQGRFKMLHLKAKHYTTDKSRINDTISTDHLKASYLKGNPNYVDLPEQWNDASSTTTMTSPIIDDHKRTSVIFDNWFKTTFSGRTLRFPEHLNDHWTLDILWIFHLVFLVLKLFGCILSLLWCQKPKNLCNF